MHQDFSPRALTFVEPHLMWRALASPPIPLGGLSFLETPMSYSKILEGTDFLSAMHADAMTL